MFVKEYLDALRLKEIIGKIGFFMVGILFSKPSPTIGNLISLIHFSGICLINGITIYLINAALGYTKDKPNERLIVTRKFSVQTTVLVAVVLFVISFIWLYLYSAKLLLPAFAVYVVWIIYSMPHGLKGVPVMGLLCAFIGQIVHFHVGYLVFSDWSTGSILLSIYFALLFSAGHAIHEVIDYKADKEVEVRTSAVAFGKEAMFRVSDYIFTGSIVYLMGLGWLQILPLILTIPYMLAFIYQHWFLSKPFLDDNSVFVFRRKYMIAYSLATAAVIVLIYVL